MNERNHIGDRRVRLKIKDNFVYLYDRHCPRPLQKLGTEHHKTPSTHTRPHTIQTTYCEGTRPSLGLTAKF
jgi:hypothetical protein